MPFSALAEAPHKVRRLTESGVNRRYCMPRISLDVVQIARPCPAEWAAMKPAAAFDADRVRHCELCRLNVYNVAEMTRREAEELIERNEASGGGRLCMQLARRPDGTIVTRDCATAREQLRRAARRTRWMAVAATAAVVSTVTLALTGGVRDRVQTSLDAWVDRENARRFVPMPGWSAYPGEAVVLGDIAAPQ